MHRATLDQLATAPVGRYVAGTSFAHFCASPALWGFVVWGHPTMDDARQLGRSLVLELAAPAEPHVSIIDARRLAFAEPLVFQAGETYLRMRAAALSAWVGKLAIVRPPGIAGAVMAGAYDVVTRPYPVAVFETPEAAFEWLDADVSPTAGAQLVDAIYHDATGVPREVAMLRAMLDIHVDGVTIDRAAKQLGVSQRSLQRRLADAGTTFSAELASARMRLAKRLLAETDTAVTEIALELGCTSLQAFSAQFRRHAGEPPSTFRERARRSR